MVSSANLREQEQRKVFNRQPWGRMMTEEMLLPSLTCWGLFVRKSNISGPKVLSLHLVFSFVRFKFQFLLTLEHREP